MTRARGIVLTRVALIIGVIGVVELLCRLHVIKPLTMISPSQMAFELARMIASGELDSSRGLHLCGGGGCLRSPRSWLGAS